MPYIKRFEWDLKQQNNKSRLIFQYVPPSFSVRLHLHAECSQLLLLISLDPSCIQSEQKHTGIYLPSLNITLKFTDKPLSLPFTSTVAHHRHHLLHISMATLAFYQWHDSVK